MTTTYFVLWIFYSSLWSWNGQVMGPGWASIAVFNEMETCATFKSLYTKKEQVALCLPPQIYLPPAMFATEEEIERLMTEEEGI